MIRAAVPLNLIENGRILPDPVLWAWQCVSLTNEGKRIECIWRKRSLKKKRGWRDMQRNGVGVSEIHGWKEEEKEVYFGFVGVGGGRRNARNQGIRGTFKKEVINRQQPRYMYSHGWPPVTSPNVLCHPENARHVAAAVEEEDRDQIFFFLFLFFSFFTRSPCRSCLPNL